MVDLSPLRERFSGKVLCIAGLGASGMAVFRACRKAGIDTRLWDDREDMRNAAVAEGGTLYTPDTWPPDAAALCLAPGVPQSHPAAVAARAAGVPVLGDMELFHMARPRARKICVTGTNGKSTTTALIAHILGEAGMPHAMGGNIGVPVVDLPDLAGGGLYVLELSSYQIDLLHDFTAEIAALINLSPDHLERYGDFESYRASKERIFRGGGTAIIGIDDPASAKTFDNVKKAGQREMIAVSVERPMTRGIFVSKEGMLFDTDHKVINLISCQSLRGRHNWQNAAVAYAAATVAGVEPKAIANALATFPGLAHRQFVVARIGGIPYVNDSKATNDQAAAVALAAYPRIYWIAGGKSKGAGYRECEKHLSHVRHAFLIGEAEEEMAGWLLKRGVKFTRCGDLASATHKAHAMAQRERADQAAVLLSPACASFDQFRSFEHRGDTFAEIVRDIEDASKRKAGLP